MVQVNTKKSLKLSKPNINTKIITYKAYKKRFIAKKRGATTKKRYIKKITNNNTKPISKYYSY